MTHTPPGSAAVSPLRRSSVRGASVLLAVLTALMLAACGSSSSSSSSSSSASSGSSSASSSAGGGAKSLTLGSKDFTEEFILSQLYQQVLQAHGYHVNLKGNIGSTEVVDKALTSGQIDAYPEYTGEATATVFNINKTVSSAKQAYNLAKAAYAKRGQTLSAMTPFYDTDAIGVLKTYAQKYGLKTVADLKKVPHFTVGGRPEFLGRQEGAAGMKSVYGLHNFSFKSLAAGLNYQALDNHTVDAIDVFTTDPQLASGKYTVLKDPKNIFGFQNVVMVINTPKLRQLGGARFLAIINKVNSLLTTPAMVSMNKAVALDKQSPATVAHSFLTANHLI